MQQDHMERLFKTVQALSIVAGVVISVLSFNEARKQEALAQQAEAGKQQLEAAKPFLELRQRLYLDAVKQAAILANPEPHVQNVPLLHRRWSRITAQGNILGTGHVVEVRYPGLKQPFRGCNSPTRSVY